MDIAIYIIKIIAAIFASLVLLGILYQVGLWMFVKLINGGDWLIVHTVKWTIAILSGLFIKARDLFLLLWSAITSPIVHLFLSCWRRLTETLKLWSLYWRYGRSEFKSFRAFRRHMRDEEDQSPQENPKPIEPYQDALALFGFTQTENFTKTDLKKRYRVLISHVHPDKGCPTSVLARQVNRALATINQKRKWK